MKYTYIILLLFSFTFGYSQNSNDIEKAVCSKYKNGAYKETGLLKNNKLHGQWVKYSQSGEAIVVGNYEEGSKVGKWIFVDNKLGVITEVKYADNKVLKIKKFIYDTPTATLSYIR